MARTTKPQSDGLQFRSFSVEPISDDKPNTFRAVAATEAPVMMPDWDRMELVPEVLLMSGAKMPNDRTVPLLNSHNRNDVDDVLGSASEMRTDGNELQASIVISETENKIATKVREKHIRDLSVGYRVEKKRFVPEGKTERIAGRDFTGPVNAVTSWTVREVSLTPIGADAQAKMRGLNGNPFEREAPMLSKENRDKLVARGMPADTEDAAAFQWAIDNPEIREVERKEEKKPKMELVPDFEERLNESLPRILATIENKLEAAERDRREAERAKRVTVVEFAKSECERRGIPHRAQDVADCDDLSSAGKRLLEVLYEEQEKRGKESGYVSFGADRSEKYFDEMRSSLGHRVLSGVKPHVFEKIAKDFKLGEGNEFRGLSLLNIARNCLEVDGINIRLLNDSQIAQAALGFGHQFGLRTNLDNAFASRGGSAYHHSGSFLKLTQDAFDMSLRAGYEEYDRTAMKVFPVGDPFQSFNAKHIIQTGEIPNLEQWDGINPPNQVSIADAEETVKPEAYHNMMSLGWKLLINDRLDGLSSVPRKFGEAAARTLNAHVWSIVTANANLQDGQALFSAATGNRKKNNLTDSGSGAAPSVSTIQTGFNLMMQQVGVNTPENNASAAILGVKPKFIVFPSAHYTNALQTVKSVTDPSASNDIKFNPFNYLEPVCVPELDANSTTAWYLISDDVDTIKIYFLNGYETPQTRQWRDEETLAVKFGILQVYAAKALDHRGFYKNVGS